MEEVRAALQPSALLPRPGLHTLATPWQRHYGSQAPEQQHAMEQLAWLLDGPSGPFGPPPIDMLLEHCLMPLIKQRVGYRV